MPSIAQQLRVDRRRRVRRRRVTVGVLVAIPAALLGGRLVADASTEPPAGAMSATWSSSSPTAPTLPAPPPAPTTTTTRPTSTQTGLDPGLVRAFERARAEAADTGHHLTINSGFRTADEQARLLEAEVEKRGSRDEALWWVFPPDESMHVQGLAIDVGDGGAADWLVDAGPRFGLCRTLDWEWWHFEWRERWEDAGSCPAPARTPDDAPQA